MNLEGFLIVVFIASLLRVGECRCPRPCPRPKDDPLLSYCCRRVCCDVDSFLDFIDRGIAASKQDISIQPPSNNDYDWDPRYNIGSRYAMRGEKGICPCPGPTDNPLLNHCCGEVCCDGDSYHDFLNREIADNRQMTDSSRRSLEGSRNEWKRERDSGQGYGSVWDILGIIFLIFGLLISGLAVGFLWNKYCHDQTKAICPGFCQLKKSDDPAEITCENFNQRQPSDYRRQKKSRSTTSLYKHIDHQPIHQPIGWRDDHQSAHEPIGWPVPMDHYTFEEPQLTDFHQEEQNIARNPNVSEYQLEDRNPDLEVQRIMGDQHRNSYRDNGYDFNISHPSEIKNDFNISPNNSSNNGNNFNISHGCPSENRKALNMPLVYPSENPPDYYEVVKPKNWI